MIEVRCKACNKLIAKAVVFIGVVKCARCSFIFEFKLYSNVADPIKVIDKDEDK